MNERINELAEQAWTYVMVCDERYSKSSTQLFNEKFAELIVRECAQRCDPIPGLEFSAEVEAARAGCKKDILKGFGIEE
jgi:hypothetical protein